MACLLWQKVCQPVAALRNKLLPLKEDSRSNPGGVEARMFGCLEPWRLVGLPAGWLAGLDWIGCELLLDRGKWWDWWIPRALTRSSSRRGRRITEVDYLK